MQSVGLADRAQEWPRVLYGGQRQCVALARALAANPRLILLDEPLGALDALTRLEMQALIEAIWQQNRFTAILVTHDVTEAATLADRILLIETAASAPTCMSTCHGRDATVQIWQKSRNRFWGDSSQNR